MVFISKFCEQKKNGKNYQTKQIKSLENQHTSTAHVTLMKFAAVEDSLQRLVISIGFGGLLGSTPGLFVGMGLGKV